MPTTGTISAATGVISMVLLTAVAMLGILVNRRVRLPGLPRFAGLSLHRFLSLLALGFLSVHILTAIIGPYARIRLAASVIPFVAATDPFWLGLGAVAFDLMLALIVTSLLRRHIGRRTWRALHWLAYACWPTAVAHSIGTGNGMRAGRLLDLAIVCIIAVLTAAGWRLAAALRRPQASRTAPVPILARRHAAAPSQRRPSQLQLRVNPITCTGHGLCAELVPELVALDQWGYPLIADGPVPEHLARRARRAVTDCPALALRLASEMISDRNEVAAAEPAP